MARSLLQRPVLYIMLFSLVLHLGLSSAITVTETISNGSEMWGYVEVRPGANIFWHYYRSPRRVSSPGKPWPTVFYATPASSGYGNYAGIGPRDLNRQPSNKTWLHKADLIFVDTPVGTGYSYEQDERGNIVKTFPPKVSKAATDIVVLLRALTREIPTLESSPLFLLHTSYAGPYAGMISTFVATAIKAGTLNNLTLGGMVMRFDGRDTPDNAFWLSLPDYDEYRYSDV